MTADFFLVALASSQLFQLLYMPASSCAVHVVWLTTLLQQRCIHANTLLLPS